MTSAKTGEANSKTLLHNIATDIHFWIPLLVLIAGLLLLHKLS